MHILCLPEVSFLKQIVYFVLSSDDELISRPHFIYLNSTDSFSVTAFFLVNPLFKITSVPSYFIFFNFIIFLNTWLL